jgi:hypothetical protein
VGEGRSQRQVIDKRSGLIFWIGDRKAQEIQDINHKILE